MRVEPISPTNAKGKRILMNKQLITLILFAAGIILSACGPANNEPTSNTTPDSGYPGDNSTNNPSSYPATVDETQNSESYPAPQANVDESRRFTFTTPVKAGDTQVSGTGPANVPIKIVNVSYMGEFLGGGQTDASGNFVIELTNSLNAQDLLGIQLNDTSLENDFRSNPGPDYTDFPMVGLLLTTAVVEP